MRDTTANAGNTRKTTPSYDTVGAFPYLGISSQGLEGESRATVALGRGKGHPSGINGQLSGKAGKLNIYFHFS